MPCAPSFPSSGHRSRGKLLLRSISSARGAIRADAKVRTLSRSCSAVSPSPNRRPGRLLKAIRERPPHTADAPRQSMARRSRGFNEGSAIPVALLVFAFDVLAGVVLHQGAGDQAYD